MKFLTLALLLFSIVACRDEEGVWDDLSQADQAVIRERASAKCLGEEQSDIDDIIRRSNDKMTDAQRRDTWKVVLSKDSAALYTSYIHVYKRTNDAIYYVYLKKNESGTVSQFIKVTKAENAEYFRDLQRKKCDLAKKDERLDTKYNSATLTNSKFEGRLIRPREDNTTNKTYNVETFTYTYNRDYPAVFGIISQLREVKTYDAKTDAQKGNAETYKTVITVENDIDEDDLGDSYGDSGKFPNPTLCIAKFTPATVDKPIIYQIPFLINALNCDPTGPDANGDGVKDFVATELVPIT